MGPLAGLVARRLALGLLTLFVVSVIIFLGVSLLPGDVATELLGQSATPATVAALRHSLGLDQPLVARYGLWLGGILQGDFGTSLANGRPIGHLVAARFGNTIFLASVAALISVPLSVGLGLLAALYRGSLLDRTINALTLVSISFPEFFLAYILIVILSMQAGLLPSLATLNEGMGLAEQLHRIALPALTLTLVVIAHMMRMTRASILGVLASPFIEMARLKGASPARVIVRHALPNAWSPIINVIVLNLAYLVVGVVVVEVVFVYPGLGQLMVDSVQKRDIPVVQACSLLFAATFVGLNLTADLLSMLANPRLRHAR
ncbi:ABC transporter permease [Mangrovibrevibacter kandeliae]|uniref:ABC transporter permease n=1 Tax=Mangrovibrevibacter kandeliae TaxID=2968473 RepID=UPI002118A5BB|nr:ABC transporter permease [Aurantimonas sp. CSK15Z-1]MCQ8784006.1 ABC transporter permease [Aurantimonas sp. CSK15Z-1]